LREFVKPVILALGVCGNGVGAAVADTTLPGAVGTAGNRGLHRRIRGGLILNSSIKKTPYLLGKGRPIFSKIQKTATR